MKITKKNVIEVSDWDRLIMDTYGRPYSFQQQNGCQDRGAFPLTVPDGCDDDWLDTVPEIVNGEEMGVNFKSWLERDPKQPLKDQKYGHELDLWWTRNFYPEIQAVANDLHERGLLEAGEYLIDIDW